MKHTHNRIFCLLCLVMIVGALVFATTVSACAEESEQSQSEQPTVAETVASFAGEYSTEIFSALSLVGTLIVSFAYKKGLIPSLSSALTGMSADLGKGIGNIEKVASSLSSSSDATLKKIGDGVSSALQIAEKANACTEKVTIYLEEMNEKLKSEKNDRAVLSTVLISQIDMFYQFFMSVNLPQYQKDALGEAYNGMKKTIALMAEIKEVSVNEG